MTWNLLREFIREAAGKSSKPEGPSSGHFGKYVFADQREDVPNEPNTPEEDSLADALDKHFHGRPQELQGWIDELIKDKKDYPSVLEPPARSKRAYRTMTVPTKVLEDVIGHSLSPEDFDGEVHFTSGGVQKPIGGRSFYSWTLEPDIFYGLRKDWGSLFSTDWIKNKVGGKGFVVFISADIDDNTFLLNPDKIEKAGLAGQFSYQREVLSVGPVNLADVAYFYFDSDSDTTSEPQMIRAAISGIEA